MRVVTSCAPCSQEPWSPAHDGESDPLMLAHCLNHCLSGRAPETSAASSDGGLGAIHGHRAHGSPDTSLDSGGMDGQFPSLDAGQ